MKPRNEREREAVKLYRQMPPLTNSQRLWIEKCVVGAQIFTAGGKCWCTKCGGEWETEQREGRATCPHCGTESMIKKSRKTHITDYGYVQFFQVYKGWQVIKYLLIRWNCKKGRKQLIYDMNVIQKWCQPGRPMITLGAALGMNCYYRKIPYSLWGDFLTIKDGHGDWYSEWMECKTYPRRSFLSVYTKNLGKNPSFALIDAPTLLGDIFGCPYLESLYKAGNYDKLKGMLRSVEYLNKYWPSVKIALRHGYEPDHWPSYWEHLQALKYLRYDMHSPRYVAPKDFGVLHDRIMRQYRNRLDKIARTRNENNRLRYAIQQEEWEKRRAEEAHKYAQTFAERIAKFAGLQIEDADLVISPLMTIEAFKDEGNAMHHCVFTNNYWKNKDCIILSARTLAENERVETIEVSLIDYTIAQSQGIYNVPTERHQEIIGLVTNAMPRIKQMATAG